MTPLIFDSTVVEPKVLAEIYREHREGIEETLSRLRNPEVEVTDTTRLERAKEFGAAVLAALPVDPSETELRPMVNASYESMLVLIDLMKNSLRISKVPRPASASS